MNKWLTRILIPFYFLLMLAFSVYSYSQVDLNLTLSSNAFYQFLQSKLTYLGYFQRHISAYIYLLLLILLYIFYIFFLKASKNFKDSHVLNKLIYINIFFAIFSYPAFSHDFFNYLFDARILTKYHLNPYMHSALDFPGDLWVRFMHWTHRTYPYGPAWLIVTLPFSFLGFGKFVLTVFLFKLMFAVIYFINISLIREIVKKISKSYEYTSLIFFALNPLIIIETLISPHNESLMLLFLLLSLKILMVNKNVFKSILWLLISALVKYATIALMPLYIIKNNLLSTKRFMSATIFLLVIPLVVQVFNREAYPWYFVTLIGVSVFTFSLNIYGFLIALSFGALLRYFPYLYTGTYSEDQYIIMNLFIVIPLILFLFYRLANLLIFKTKTNNSL